MALSFVDTVCPQCKCMGKYDYIGSFTYLLTILMLTLLYTIIIIKIDFYKELYECDDASVSSNGETLSLDI